MHRILLFVLIALTACSKKKVIRDSPLFSQGKRLAEITDKRLEELSGLAESVCNPGLMWAENDGGNKAEIFLIDRKAKVKLTCVLDGLENRDWEDIAVGPGPDSTKSYIYLAEIGDNNAVYPVKNIYRFEEPSLEKSKRIKISAIDTISFKLEGALKDAETMLVDPSTRNIYILSKREEPVHVYELPYPQSTNDTVIIKSVATVQTSQLTGGSVSADGAEVLIKNYDDIFYFKRSPGMSLVDVLKQKPVILPYESEPQGEAITWARDGSGFFTASEAVVGEESFLYFFKRKTSVGQVVLNPGVDPGTGHSR